MPKFVTNSATDSFFSDCDESEPVPSSSGLLPAASDKIALAVGLLALQSARNENNAADTFAATN
jgi:hypothetical protein